MTGENASGANLGAFPYENMSNLSNMMLAKRIG